MKSERKHQTQAIGALIEDIKFHKESIKFFGKVKAEYIFKDSPMRKQLNEIVDFHRKEIDKTQNEIQLCQRIIKEIDKPEFTPDGERIKKLK